MSLIHAQPALATRSARDESVTEIAICGECESYLVMSVLNVIS